MMHRDLIGAFIDAAVDDPARAERLLDDHPELREARWLHGETILHFLAVEGYTGAVQFLGRLGFDANAPNEFGNPPLIDVAMLGNEEVVAVLLSLGADPNAHSLTLDNPLHRAIRSGNARVVELLLMAGARGDYVTNIDETAFDALPEELAMRQAVEAVLRRYGVTRD